MKWNWQQKDWPAFRWDAAALAPLERQFLLHSGEFIGAFKHVESSDKDALKIELISNEALKTSEVEGEILNRSSVQASLIQQFGLGPRQARIPAAERGIAEMMVDLYRSFADPLEDEVMFRWHTMLTGDDRSVGVIGGYRTHHDPTQVVSGADDKRAVHFEAPPSDQIPTDMKAFIKWFNATSPGDKRALDPLVRAGIAHLYFVSIHLFEDGNGRIARALAEKALAQGIGQPTLIALTYTIQRKRKDYYAALERNNKDNEITDWLFYFANTILDAQATTMKRVDFYLSKAKFYERLRGQLNERQEKAVTRMFREGIGGFKGGMSADKYITITGTSRATATRDLQDLVAKGALTRTGERKHTRYHINLTD
ncbi:MAG: Fic family protein [Proteobacteria bacterium]|nr:Fic family protein [Pseudomonadota bacterium]